MCSKPRQKMLLAVFSDTVTKQNCWVRYQFPVFMAMKIESASLSVKEKARDYRILRISHFFEKMKY